MISASVGKSGPLTCSQSSAVEVFGASSSRMHALATSLMLCGGMSVAIPTAIPVAPLSRTLGRRAGRTDGSLSVPSKFGAQSTVPCPSSDKRTCAYGANRASV